MKKELKTAATNHDFANVVDYHFTSGALFDLVPEMRGLDLVPQNPEFHPEGDVYTHTLGVIEFLPDDADLTMRLAALLHDLGKISTTEINDGRITAHGHEKVSAEMVRPILSRFDLSDDVVDDVEFIVRHHMTAHSSFATKRTIRRLVNKGGVALVDKLLKFGVADVSAASRNFTDCNRLRELFDDVVNATEDDVQGNKFPVDGHFIMSKLNIPPGPRVGEILADLRRHLGDDATIDDVERHIRVYG